MDLRSPCPLNAAVEVLGDRWTLLVLRDVMFEDRRYFRGLLTGSKEGIASNILADRLVRLVDAGLLSRGTAARGQRARYSLTEAGIQTLPLISALSGWALAWHPDGADLRAERELMLEADPDAQAELMKVLRARHLGSQSDQHAGPRPLGEP